MAGDIKNKVQQQFSKYSSTSGQQRQSVCMIILEKISRKISFQQATILQRIFNIIATLPFFIRNCCVCIQFYCEAKFMKRMHN